MCVADKTKEKIRKELEKHAAKCYDTPLLDPEFTIAPWWRIAKLHKSVP